jgi:hypothetical protein
MLITLANPLINTLFPKEGLFQSLFVANAEPKFPYAPMFLALAVVVNLFVLVGNVSLATFQSGIGQTKQIMKQSVLTLAFGLPLAYFSVAYFYSLGSNAQASATFAVVGGLIGVLIASMPGMIWCIVWSWRNYRVKADFGASAKIFAASLIASATAFIPINFLVMPWWMTLAVAFGVFVFAYLSASPLIGAVNRVDIENFRAMFSGLGVVSKIINFPLMFMSKMCRHTEQKSIRKPLKVSEESLHRAT